eukprot:6886386-Alexandrium_andersonii.AAC.1
MSASLVGSEMCIRDRHTRAGLLGAVPKGHARARLHRLRRCHEHVQDVYCLLYTSDAADDM